MGTSRDVGPILLGFHRRESQGEAPVLLPRVCGKLLGFGGALRNADRLVEGDSKYVCTNSWLAVCCLSTGHTRSLIGLRTYKGARLRLAVRQTPVQSCTLFTTLDLFLPDGARVWN